VANLVREAGMNDMTIAEAFDLALQRHRAGRLADAEGLYRQILAAQPDYAEALHHLGVIAHQVGRHDLAVEWIRQAILHSPNNPVAHYNLGEACRTIGRLDDAITAFHRALQLQPNYPEAHNNLGAALAGQGWHEEALAAYRRALQLKPDLPEAHNNLGNALMERGQLGEAEGACRRALELRPEFAEAENGLGAALAGQGRPEEAIAAYRRALGLKPNYPEAHNNLGNVLRERGQIDEALAAYRRALELRPDFAEAHNNRGVALRERGQLDEAIAAHQRALELDPGSPETHNNLGVALREQGHFVEAIAAHHCALELKPDYPEAHNNLGAALAGQGQLEEAIAAYRRALELKSGYPEAHNNLGAALAGQGQVQEAIAEYRQALEISPEQAWVHSNLIYTLHFHPGHDNRSISEERERWNRRFSEPLKPLIKPHANDPAVAGPLRVGYVSPDFRDHVVGRNLRPLFEHHDKKDFEILCYSGVARPDKMTEEFRRHTDHWRSTAGVPDEALAEMIRRDGVDILVDLSQHMAGNRLPMFARQPAPVQVSFAGYPESTGLEAIGHRISDRYLEANSEEAGRSERVHLIDSFWCYDPRGVEIDVHGLPALESGRVTFGCLNNFCKVNDRVLSLWARALGMVKESRLVLLSGSGSHRQRTMEALEREGVEARRVEFVELRPRREYLELYHRLDMVLDTFPYNGHTTSLDALWMGVPVVSLAGETSVARAGLSQLSNLGLPELAAHCEEEYVRTAVELAGDRQRLAQLRSTLRDRMKSSILMDAARFARQVERAYREMWQMWRLGQPPGGQ
jgi:protein O-GlcNAc transferase